MAQLIKVQLTAEELATGEVVISGSKGKVFLPRGSGEHIFWFELDDNTTRNVQFNGFGAQRGENCPTQPVNNVKRQIYDVQFAGTNASFKDKNNNDGVLRFCYTWFFICNNGQTPIFDPIIDNGGK